MNIKPNKLLAGAFSFLAALAISQVAAMAQTVQLTLLSPPNNGASTAGIDLSPYNFSITPLAPTGSTYTTTLICDDFSDEITQGESWTATVFNPASVPTSGLGSTATIADYEEIGYLAYELMQPPTPTTGAPSTAGGPDQAALSFAIWSILEPTTVTNAVAQTDLGATDYAGYTAALSVANNIATNPENSALALAYLNNLIIYQPVSGTQQNPSNAGTPQQFVGLNTPTLNNLPPIMPEASSPVFLGFDLLTLFAAVFVIRRRGISNATASR